MSTMSVKEALAKVLEDMKAMSAEDLMSELRDHRDGELAQALRSAQEFLNEYCSVVFSYPIIQSSSLEDIEAIFTTRNMAIECIELFLAANDHQYQLAA